MSDPNSMEARGGLDKPGTPPSGVGGMSPKTRPDYQDQWPPNPDPSESAAAKAKENEEARDAALAGNRGETVAPASKATNKEDKSK